MSEALQHPPKIGQEAQETGNQAEREDFRMVTFSLGRKAYGIDIMRVKEISSARRFTYVPNTIPYVRGVFNLRGEITPVIDMRLFFNLEITGERSELDITRNNEIFEDLIILTFDSISIGIIVDSISHVVGVRHETIQRSHPLFSELEVPYIDGIVEYNDQLYIILAMDRILDPYLDPGEQVSFKLEAALDNITRGSLSTPMATFSTGATNPNSGTEQDFGKEAALAQRAAQPSAEKSLDKTEAEAELLQAESAEADKENAFGSEFSESAESASLQNQNLSSGLDPLASALEQEGILFSPLSEKGIQQKYLEWCHKKNIEPSMSDLLESPHNRKELLALLESKDRNSYWSAELGEALQNYFRNRSGNLNVWHADCGNGRETYSIAAALIAAAPEANIQVRAADSNLLEVAKAPLQSVGSALELHEWLRPYLNEERGSKGYTFTKFLTDCIIFEYQDVIHSTPHTKPDLIVMRDLLFRHPQEEQDYVLTTIERSLKQGGLLIIGDNEELDEEKWELLDSEPLKIYRARSS